MKLIKAFLILCFTVLPVTGFSDTSTNPYAGVWVFVSGEYQLENGNVISATRDDVIAVKTVSEKNFALVNMKPGAFSGYLQGDFLVGQKGYQEVVTSGGGEEYVGNTYSFTGKLETRKENGTAVTYWIHQGQVNGVTEKETWKKMH